jgi:acetylornithine deacetylase
MQDLRKTIHDYIYDQQDRFVGFLSELVKFDSVIGDNGIVGKEGPAQEWLSNQLRKMKAEVHAFEPDNDKIKDWPSFNPNHHYNGRPNVIGIWQGSDRENYRSIILNGHVDVIPPGFPEKWSVPPFKGIVKNGYIYGRGTVDMKGGLSAAIMAMSTLKELGLDLKGDVLLESIVDEEGGGNGTLAARAEGYKADAAVILEPTSLQIHRANLGALQFSITVPGLSTHAGLKPFGVSALDKAFKIIKTLDELEHCWLLSKHHPLLSKQSFVFGMCEAGFSPAAVPDRCVIRGVLHYLPVILEDGKEIFQEMNDVKKEIENVISNVCQGDHFLRDNPAKITWTQDTPPFYTSGKEEIVKIAEKTFEDILGEAIIAGMLMGSDGRCFQYANIPVIVCGPGNPNQAHSVDERLDISEYLKGIEVIANLIYHWTSISRF